MMIRISEVVVVPDLRTISTETRMISGEYVK
jgi:hypothetical protein